MSNMRVDNRVSLLHLVYTHTHTSHERKGVSCVWERKRGMVCLWAIWCHRWYPCTGSGECELCGVVTYVYIYDTNTNNRNVNTTYGQFDQPKEMQIYQYREVSFLHIPYGGSKVITCSCAEGSLGTRLHIQHVYINGRAVYLQCDLPKMLMHRYIYRAYPAKLQ